MKNNNQNNFDFSEIDIDLNGIENDQDQPSILNLVDQMQKSLMVGNND